LHCSRGFAVKWSCVTKSPCGRFCFTRATWWRSHFTWPTEFFHVMQKKTPQRTLV